MKTKLLAMAFLAAGSMFAQTRFSFSVGLGGYNHGYYNAAPYVAVRPPCPGPDFFWTGDYWARRPHYGYQVQRSYFYGRDHDRDFRRDHDDRDDRYDRDDRRYDRRDDNYGNGFRSR